MSANRFDQLIDLWWAKLKTAFMSSVRSIIDFAQIGLIAERLEKGDIDGAVRAVGLDPVQFREFDKAIAEAFEDGGKFSSKRVPAIKQPDGHRLVVQFDVRNPRAEQWLKDHSSKLVSQIMDDQRTMVQQALRTGMELGQNPRTVALDLIGRIGSNGQRSGGLIGLTSSQEQWVRKYEAELRSDNPTAALSRTLRDKRFDGAVNRAAKAGEPLSADAIQNMTTAYRNRALRYRAETVARTEALSSLHESQEEAFRQAAAKGGVDVRTITRVWHTSGDKRVRDSHRAMKGQSVGLHETFVTPSGARLAYPGDPNGPASEIINCRCWVENSIDFMRGLT
jgi:hypothetical protein